MTSLIPPADDEGLRRHEISKRRAGPVSALRPVQPRPGIDTTRGNAGAPADPHPPRGERRRAERRRRRVAVILDTRCNVERRGRYRGDRA